MPEENQVPELKLVTFIQACKLFFGLLPNQTLLQFMAEVKALTPADKTEMVELFRGVGLDATKQS
ncbi:MAG: hypothetical protein ABWY25_01475 [Paenisporosarcina sp.]